MTYVEGRFSDRRSKRTALLVLGVVFGLSCARGVVSSFPRDDQTGPLAPEPGVALAVPIQDRGPEPVLQAEQRPPAKVRAPPRPRRETPAAPVEMAVSPVEAATPAAAVTTPETEPLPSVDLPEPLSQEDPRR